MNRTDALSVVSASLLLFVLVGFDGLSGDITQYLLAAHKLNDPGFLANDWFVQKTQSFHPFFEHYASWWLKSDKLSVGLLVWFVVNLFLLSGAIVVWLRTLGVTERMPLAVIVVVAILIVGVRQGWGRYEVLTDQALPAYLAYPTALVAIALLFHRRFFSSACAVAVTFAIHHGLGALLALLLAGPFLATLPRSREELIRAGLGAVVLVVVFLPSVIGTVNLDAGHTEDFLIFFYGRAPNHYAIQYSGLNVHLATLHIFVVSVLLASMLPSSALRSQILALVMGTTVLCLMGYLFLEVWYVPQFVRLFPYRAIPILVVVNACMLAFLLLRRTSTRFELVTAVAVLVSGIVFHYSVVAWFVILGIAVVLRFLPRGVPVGARGRRAALIAVLVVGAVEVVNNLYLYPPRYFREPATVRYAALGRAIEEHTPKDAVIVVPPWMVGTRLIIKRAIVVNFKAFPIYAGEMAQWADRMRDISGVDPRNARRYLDIGANIYKVYARGYRARAMEDLEAAARKYGADFILVSTRSRFHHEAAEAGIPALWSGHGLALYRTRGESS